MSTQLATSDLDRGALRSSADVGDFIALLKPRVMSLVLFTALAGMVAAPGTIHPVFAITALLCIGVGAGASGALNMWYDADIDAQMQRTAARPIPRGKVSPEDALGFGIFLSAAAVLTMGLLVNWVAAFLLAFTIAFYLVVYTMWLKRSTPQNIVIGGAAGAFPPMVGWAAATGTVSIESVVLFALIFLWTPPHFWALALYRCRDYERVGVPMLPVVRGADETRRQIWLYSLVLAPTGVLPFLMGFAGVVYGITATIVGVIFLRDAWRVYTVRDGKAGDDAARKLFKFSILYLFVIFAVLLVENTIGAQTLGAVGLWLS